MTYGEIFVIVMPYVLSVITLYANWLAGSRHPLTWVISIANQVLWLIFILVSQQWGFLLLTVSLTYIFYRNHRKWAAESAAQNSNLSEKRT